MQGVAAEALHLQGKKKLELRASVGCRGSRLNLFISGTETSIVMIEGEADFLTEEQMTAAIDLGMSVIRQLCKGLKAFAARSAPRPCA